MGFKRVALEPEQSVYLYALLSEASFNSVSLYTDGKLRDDVSFDGYLRSRGIERAGPVPEAMIVFLWVVAGAVILAFTCWGVYAVLQKLTDRFSIK